jgi:hypothetical protein
LILTSGRALSTQANAEVQSILRATGEIGQDEQRITVLDRIAMSREEARTMAPYREGLVVEIRANMPRQGLERGTIGTIVGVTKNSVEIRSGARTLTLRPDRLAPNLKEDAVTVFAPKSISLHQNDRIRFTAPNHKHGLRNAQMATVEKLTDTAVTLKLLTTAGSSLAWMIQHCGASIWPTRSTAMRPKALPRGMALSSWIAASRCCPPRAR